MRILILFSFLFSVVISGQQEIPKEKIERMMNVTGSSERFEMVMETLIEQQRESLLFSGSDQFYDLFKEKVMSEGYQEIVELLIPIYRKYLTETEVDAIIKFYSSDAGLSMVKKFPLIGQEAMIVGQEWGEKLAGDISNKINKARETLFHKEIENCGEFKKGSFFYYLPNGDEVLVERDGELLQKEIIGANTIVSKIEWITNCRYQLWELDSDFNRLSEHPVEVNIIQSDEDSYSFISHMKGDEFYSEGYLKVKSVQK